MKRYCFRERWKTCSCAIQLGKGLSVALAHHEVERTEDGGDIGDHVPGKEHIEERKVDEGRAANFQAIGDSSAFGADVEAEFAFGVFGSEIDFASRGINALGRDDEVVNQFLHAHHYALLVGQGAFRVDEVDRAIGNGLENLTNDANGLAHLFHADLVARVTIAFFRNGDMSKS